MKKLILTLLISSLIITVSFAQKFWNSRFWNSGCPDKKNWSIVAYLGVNFLNAGKQIEDAMIEYGYNKSVRGYGFFSPTTYVKEHPYTDKIDGISWMVSVKRYIKFPFSIGLYTGKTYFASTHGYNGTTYLGIDHSVFSVSPIISFNSYDIFSIGLGPSIYFTNTWKEDREEGECKHTKLGFMIDVGIRIPRKSLFFFAINGQYRYVGKVEIGPFSVYKDTFPKTKVNYDHWLIGIGFGVRF
ncbi:MAG: hypothetical protein H8D45_06250 [Bacteroidetes bacterium]|nr:hypothetical protein [Bacteroidota bacterium]